MHPQIVLTMKIIKTTPILLVFVVLLVSAFTTSCSKNTEASNFSEESLALDNVIEVDEIKRIRILKYLHHLLCKEDLYNVISDQDPAYWDSYNSAKEYYTIESQSIRVDKNSQGESYEVVFRLVAKEDLHLVLTITYNFYFNVMRMGRWDFVPKHLRNRVKNEIYPAYKKMRSINKSKDYPYSHKWSKSLMCADYKKEDEYFFNVGKIKKGDFALLKGVVTYSNQTYRHSLSGNVEILSDPHSILWMYLCSYRSGEIKNYELKPAYFPKKIAMYYLGAKSIKEELTGLTHAEVRKLLIEKKCMKRIYPTFDENPYGNHFIKARNNFTPLRPYPMEKEAILDYDLKSKKIIEMWEKNMNEMETIFDREMKNFSASDIISN